MLLHKVAVGLLHKFWIGTGLVRQEIALRLVKLRQLWCLETVRIKPLSLHSSSLEWSLPKTSRGNEVRRRVKCARALAEEIFAPKGLRILFGHL